MDLNTLLPAYITRGKTCCFTGHRQIPPDLRDDITNAVRRRIKILYQSGYRYFMAGGAIGFDMLAELEVLRAAKYDPTIQLILVLPCYNQTAKWSTLPDYLQLIRTYKQISGLAAHVVYTSLFYNDTCMKIRNQYMVDHSSACIAYYNGKSHSGTGQTVRMAESNELSVYNIIKDLPAAE